MSLISYLLEHKPKSFNQLKQIHALLFTTGLKSPIRLSKLIENCFTLKPCINPNYAKHIVNHEIDSNTPFLFNTLIKCTKPNDSILLFANWVSNSSIVYDDHTFIFALGACARFGSLSGLYAGMQIHCRGLKLGFVSDVAVATTAVHFYAKNGRMGFARKVFDEMPVRNLVSWNALITGYSSQERDCVENCEKALVCFKHMLNYGGLGVKPSGSTLVCVLSAAAQLGSLEIGSCVHGYVVKTADGPENDVYIGTGLVDLYSKCGCLEIALDVFAMMKVRNVLTWTAMTTGLAFHGKGKEAIELLYEMKWCNVMPNIVTFTSVFTACCHSGLVEEGVHLFHKMESEFGIRPNIKHYGCIADLLGKAGHLRDAYDFIVGMPNKPDAVLLRSLLGSCRLYGDVEMGEKVGRMLLQIEQDDNRRNLSAPVEDYIGLANVYALANRWDDVSMVREEMRSRGLEINPARSASH
ncbi:pentatricopeptide repeat-containing protein At3g18970 [Silene latifolia]|uniref:pentatricopeptide repeat-containing protein At3g18970 n=1 Tax=Silene latifolia TaxID=37657 RepID=UPI003D77870C